MAYSFKDSDEYTLVAAAIHNPKNIKTAMEINAQGRPAMVAYLKPISELFNDAEPPHPGFNTKGVRSQIGKMIGEIFYEKGYKRELNKVYPITEPTGKFFTPTQATHFRKSKEDI